MALDFHRVYDGSPSIFMGELPVYWSDVPADVVVNLCGVYPMGGGMGRTCLSLPMLDVIEEEEGPGQLAVEAFLEAVHVVAHDKSTYWHCHAGLNRSGFMLAAYLHRHRGMRISRAIALLRERRSEAVLCNSTFERRLRRWYGSADEQAFTPRSLEDYLSLRTGR